MEELKVKSVQKWHKLFQKLRTDYEGKKKKRWAGAVLGAEPLKEVVWSMYLCLGANMFAPAGEEG